MRANLLRRAVVVTPFVFGLGAGCASTNDDDAVVDVPPIVTRIAPAAGDPPPGDTDPCIYHPPPVGRGPGPGDLDPYFGCVGVASYGSSSTAFDIRGLAIQSDDKIIAVGSSNTGSNPDTWVARFTANGHLDTTFGTGGVFTMDFTAPFGGSESADAVIVQSDGHIVVGGGFQNTNVRKAFLIRLTVGGAPDPGFGASGMVILDGMTWVRALALQSGDAVGVVGENCPTDDMSCWATYGRFSGITGAPNPLFAPGSGGIASTLLGGFNSAHGYAVAATSNDTVVVAGVTQSMNTSLDVALGKFVGNTVATGFGSNGTKTYSLAGFQMARGIVPISTGYAIAEAAHTGNRFAVRRIDSVGTPIVAYGSGGVATDVFEGFGASAFGLVAGADSKVVAAGRAINATGNTRMAVARFTTTGSLDPTFSDDGHTLISAKADDAAAYAIARQSTGKLIVGGWSLSPNEKTRAALVRILY